MATRAHVTRQILLRNRSGRVLMRLDGVNAMAIGTRRRQRVAVRNSLPVNTGHKCVFNGGVALAAGGRHVELVNRRMLIGGRKNLVRTVAVGTNRSAL